jgi:hypothetical protein
MQAMERKEGREMTKFELYALMISLERMHDKADYEGIGLIVKKMVKTLEATDKNLKQKEEQKAAD